MAGSVLRDCQCPMGDTALQPAQEERLEKKQMKVMTDLAPLAWPELTPTQRPTVRRYGLCLCRWQRRLERHLEQRRGLISWLGLFHDAVRASAWCRIRSYQVLETLRRQKRR